MRTSFFGSLPNYDCERGLDSCSRTVGPYEQTIHLRWSPSLTDEHIEVSLWIGVYSDALMNEMLMGYAAFAHSFPILSPSLVQLAGRDCEPSMLCPSPLDSSVSCESVALEFVRWTNSFVIPFFDALRERDDAIPFLRLGWGPLASVSLGQLMADTLQFGSPQVDILTFHLS